MKSEQILEGWNWDSLLSRIKRKTLNATWIFHWDEFQTQAKNSVEIKILFMPNDGFWYLEPDIRLISQLFFVHMKFNIKHLIASIEKCHIKFHKGKQVNSSVQVKWLSRKKKKKVACLVTKQNPKFYPLVNAEQPGFCCSVCFRVIDFPGPQFPHVLTVSLWMSLFRQLLWPVE